MAKEKEDEMNAPHPPWWKGARGEWYVVAQAGLFLLVAFGPKSFSGWPVWSDSWMRIGSITGSLMLFFGFLLIMAGFFKIGKNITPLPYPKDNATLVETGPYRIVRHPMYSGVILMAFGWAFSVQGWLTFIYAAILAVFFDLKSRREEQWLRDKFPGYADYQKRVNKLIPFLY
jgi:protein-S-isoprenylcysteine O-methyltransferase Ste14